MRLYIDSYEKDAQKIHEDPQVSIASQSWHRWLPTFLKSINLCLALLCIELCGGARYFGSKGFGIFNPSVNRFIKKKKKSSSVWNKCYLLRIPHSCSCNGTLVFLFVYICGWLQVWEDTVSVLN